MNLFFIWYQRSIHHYETDENTEFVPTLLGIIIRAYKAFLNPAVLLVLFIISTDYLLQR